jgi:hypothetical protein
MNRRDVIAGAVGLLPGVGLAKILFSDEGVTEMVTKPEIEYAVWCLRNQARSVAT